MPSIRIPTPLRPYTAGQTEVFVEGDTLLTAVDNLVTQYPALQPHLFDDKGQMRPYVNLFLGDENVRDLDGLETRLNENDRLLIIPSIAGGKEVFGDSIPLFRMEGLNQIANCR